MRAHRDTLRRGVTPFGALAGDLHDVVLCAIRGRQVRPDPAEHANGPLQILNRVVKVPVLGERLVVKRRARRELLDGLDELELFSGEGPFLELEFPPRRVQRRSQCSRVARQPRSGFNPSGLLTSQSVLQVGNLALVRGGGGRLRVRLGALHRALVLQDELVQLRSHALALLRLALERTLREPSFLDGSLELNRSLPCRVLRVHEGIRGDPTAGERVGLLRTFLRRESLRRLRREPSLEVDDALRARTCVSRGVGVGPAERGEVLLVRRASRLELLRALRQPSLAFVRLRQRLPRADELGFLRQEPAFVLLRDLSEDALEDVGSARGRWSARRGI